MILWLDTIGPRNRGHLANLHISSTSWLLDPEYYSVLPNPPRPLDPMGMDSLFKLLEQPCFKYSPCPSPKRIFHGAIKSMEKFHALHTTTRAIDVVYKGCAPRKYLKPEQLRARGWELSIRDTTEMTDYTLQPKQLPDLLGSNAAL